MERQAAQNFTSTIRLTGVALAMRVSLVIMSTIGALVGLLVFQMPFVIIMTGVGVISLAGIVVNNAIVLIDYIDVCSGIGTEWIAARP